MFQQEYGAVLEHANQPIVTCDFPVPHRRRAKSTESLSYWQSGLLTPMFLVAGTFFPLGGLPTWAQVLGNLNPLFHCVELVRHAVFGFVGWPDVGHLAFLIGFALVMWRLAVRFMERKLVL